MITMKLFKYPLLYFFAKLRVILFHKLMTLLLGPIAGKMCKTAIRSLEEVVYRKQIKNHIVEIIKIHDPLIAKYNFPDNYPIHFRRDKTFEKRYIYILKNVCVSVSSGMAWLPEGYILQESVGSLRRIMGWGSTLHELFLPTKTLYIQEPIVVCPPTGYFHWLFEIMPNVLHALSTISNAKILVPEKSPKYLLDALELLFGSNDYYKKVLIARNIVRVSNLIMPQVEVYSGFVHPGDIKKLRAVLKAKIVPIESIAKESVYVSRSWIPKRRLINEEELEEKLRGLGFDIVHCENMLFRDQIALFSSAKFIVGSHGAGLSNMVWAGSPCEVLEIFPNNMFNDCYARLAVSLGFNYDYLACEPDKFGSGRIPIDNVLKKIALVTERNN